MKGLGIIPLNNALNLPYINVILIKIIYNIKDLGAVIPILFTLTLNMRGWGYKTPNHKVYKTSRFVLIIIRNKDDCTSIHVYVLWGLFGHFIFQEELPFDLSYLNALGQYFLF